MILGKRRYNSDNAKRDIMENAALIFSQKGYNQTSIQDISNASGYSKGHIYYHFQNKEKLLMDGKRSLLFYSNRETLWNSHACPL